MTRDHKARLFMYLLVVLLLHVTSAANGEDGQPRAPRILDVPSPPTSFVLEDDKEKAINFTLRVTGVPTPECTGWFFRIGEGRKEAVRNSEKFSCKVLYNDTGIAEFRLVISNPTKQDIGQYCVHFVSKDQGYTDFSFEIKDTGEEDKKFFYVIVSASAAGSLVLLFTVSAVICVCRRRCCRSERSRKRQNAQELQETVYENPSDMALSQWSTLKSSGSCRGHKLTHNCCQSSDFVRAATPDTEPSDTMNPCTSLPPSQGKPEQDHIMRGKQLLCVHEAELNEMISNLQGPRRHHPKHRSKLWKSRRQSRSLPSLYFLHETIGNASLRGRLQPYLGQAQQFPSTHPATIGRFAGNGYGMIPNTCHRGAWSNKKCGANYGSTEDSGFAPDGEDDGRSEFGSVSVAAEVTRRRNDSSTREDPSQFRLRRRSLQLTSSDNMSNSDTNEDLWDVSGKPTPRKEGEYISMHRSPTSQHQEQDDLPEPPPSCSLPFPPPFPSPPLPSPPLPSPPLPSPPLLPPPCPQSTMKLRVYENLIGPYHVCD